MNRTKHQDQKVIFSSLAVVVGNAALMKRRIHSSSTPNLTAGLRLIPRFAHPFTWSALVYQLGDPCPGSETIGFGRA
jgi:uncharacterized membrane protein YhaH (DUF805 family)